jgi:hypothetical protein
MRAIDIVNRLKEVLPKYTDDFNVVVNVSSLTKSGSTITCTTATNHGLSTGNYVTIKDAKEPITLSSITFDGDIATATSSTDHKLAKPINTYYKFYVEISSANTDYNGTFELLQVVNSTTFKFRLKTIPTATATGTLLLPDFDGYNGYKQITKISDTQFSYTQTATLQSPAQGAIKVLTSSRIDYTATIDRVKADYEQSSNAVNETWLYVVVGDAETFNNEITTQDISAQKKANQDFRLNIVQKFSLYAVLPTKSSTLAGVQSDTARNYIMPILKAIANYNFPSFFTDDKYQSTNYLGHGEEEYDKSYYIHRFDFACVGLIQSSDTIDINAGVPLQTIEANINLPFNANFR